MTEFNKRSISNNETLGERLQRARLGSGIAITDIAKQIKIRPEYIKALEQSDYKALPGNIFVKNYVRKYAKFLRLGRNTTEQLLQEELEVYQEQPDIPTTTQHLAKQPLKVKQVIIILVVLFIIIGVGTYFIFAVSNIIQPPALYIDPVPTRLMIEDRVVIVTGTTVPEAMVLINDQPVAVKEDGSFSQNMIIQNGINLFTVIAKTKRSKENIKYLQVVVE